ncbi:hypothetical protein BN1723_001250 [Verticillium longisporum]|uniref:Phosphoribosylformylglycinamidine synthase n=1 Tax=Verticillium longisporum TaxID=100787 RepID=A0A0G4NKK8_VERLO|nr:hypothetical protein BN1723_001250 [Verticillium longisporum]
MDFLTLIGGPAFTPTQAEELKGRINKHAGLESPGRAAFTSPTQLDTLGAEGLAPLRYVDNRRRIAEPECYPANPNGSPGGVAGVRSKDGRVLALMPHPERTIMADVASYVPPYVPL